MAQQAQPLQVDIVSDVVCPWCVIGYKQLMKALESLPERYQVILSLRDIQGFPYSEIGQMLGISPGTVDSRLHRARKMLRKRVHQLSARLGGDYAV